MILRGAPAARGEILARTQARRETNGRVVFAPKQRKEGKLERGPFNMRGLRPWRALRGRAFPGGATNRRGQVGSDRVRRHSQFNQQREILRRYGVDPRCVPGLQKKRCHEGDRAAGARGP